MNGHTITPRQLQILQLLDAGKSNREMAAELELSEHTVKVHIWRMFKGMGVNSRTKALAMWRESLGTPQLLTDEQIDAGARVLCRRCSEACGTNEDDEWAINSEHFKDEARAVLVAAQGITEAAQ